jgi:hypothetical protein
LELLFLAIAIKQVVRPSLKRGRNRKITYDDRNVDNLVDAVFVLY